MGALLEPGLPLLVPTPPCAGRGGGLEEASVFIPGGGGAPLTHQRLLRQVLEEGASRYPLGSQAGLPVPLGDLVGAVLLLPRLLHDAAVGIEPLPHLQASLVVVPLAPGLPEQLLHGGCAVH